MTLDTWDEATLHFKNYTGTENGVLGTAYIISENPISFNNWYYRYRNLALVPNSGELSFIESGANTEFFRSRRHQKGPLLVRNPQGLKWLGSLP